MRVPVAALPRIYPGADLKQIVGIIDIHRHQPIDHFDNILDEQRFVVVDADRSCGVRRKHREHPGINTCGFQNCFDFISNIDEFELFLGFEF